MPFPITLALPESAGTIRIRTVEEMQSYVADELQFYAWVSTYLGQIQGQGINVSAVSQGWGTLVNNMTAIRNALTQLNVEAATSAFETYFGGRNVLPLSASIKGKLVEEARLQLGVAGGIGALATVIGGRIDSGDTGQLRGVILAHEALAGTGRAARQSVQNALTGLLKRLSNQQLRAENKADELDKRVEEVIDRNHSRFRRILKTGHDARTQFTGHIEGELKRLDGSTSEAISRISAVQKTFEEHMRLEAPVTYWTGKAKRHRLASWISAGVGLAFATALIAYAVIDGNKRVIDMVDAAINKTHQWQSAYVVLTLVLFLLTIVFWIGRLISRTYVSQSHLAIDAEERATMVETYLALTKDNHISSEERILVLGSLFRASSDGLVKDDGGPDIGVAGLASKIGLGGR